MANHRYHLAPRRLTATMFLVAASLAPTCLAREQDKRDSGLSLPPLPPEDPHVKNMTTQNFVSNYETGALFDFVWGGGERPCFTPLDNTTLFYGPTIAVDLSQPCAAMRAFFANCSLGVSLQQVNGTKYLETLAEIPNDQQQQCYCSGDYWAYNAGCNACLKAHEYPSNGEGWIPPGYVSQQSSAYCTAKPTHNFREFLDAFVPSQTLTPSADADHDIERPQITTLSASQTGVAAYFTAPTSTPVFLSGTSSVSLAPYSETTNTPSATSTSNPASRRTPLPLWPAAIGLAVLV